MLGMLIRFDDTKLSIASKFKFLQASLNSRLLVRIINKPHHHHHPQGPSATLKQALVILALFRETIE